MIMRMGVEGMRPAWLKRFHSHSLGGLRMSYGVEDGCMWVEKFGRRRSASLEDDAEVWKILTNDMELNELTAEKILELVATKAAVTSGETF
jgi:hypothetical protein